MDGNTAIDHVRPAYATALVLHERGLDDVSAEQLDIAPNAIPVLLNLAKAKLERISADPASSRTFPAGTDDSVSEERWIRR